jgi:hypothetical protein
LNFVKDFDRIKANLNILADKTDDIGLKAEALNNIAAATEQFNNLPGRDSPNS